MLNPRLPIMLCTLALACSPAAIAAPYSSLYVFGDSLSDSGHFAGADGQPIRYTNQVGPDYQNSPFGAVAPMLLGAQLGIGAPELGPSEQAGQPAGGNNHAVGGLRTDEILLRITGEAGNPQRPGYLGDGRRADPKALYYLTGGGNDFLQGKVLFAYQARAAADRLLDSVNALQQGGARYIMVWMLPDLGRTPATYPTGLGGQVSLLSTAFNQQLLHGLAGVDAQIIPLNIPALFNDVLSTPEAFGLVAGDGAIATCFNGQGCDENEQYGIHSATPDPSKLLFNDGAHPSTTGHKLVADYAWSLLAAPWEVTLLPELAQASVRTHQAQLRQEWRAPWQTVGEWQLMLNASDRSVTFDRQDTSASGEGRGQHFLLGANYRPSEHWRLGVANGFEHQRVEAGSGDSRYRMDSYLLSAFGQYRASHLWADLTATGGISRFEGQRRFALGLQNRAEKGETHGSSLALGGRLGLDLAGSDSSWHLSPFISAHYGRTTIKGYRERGERSTALSFAEQQRDSRRLGAGLQATVPFGPRLALQGEISHEREFADLQRTLTIGQNSLPGLDFTLPGYQIPGSQNNASLALRYQVAAGWALQAAYTWQKSAATTEQGVGAGLNISF
jgi:outer membrane lipase/esterase